jgi:hypothetical protein
LRICLIRRICPAVSDFGHYGTGALGTGVLHLVAVAAWLQFAGRPAVSIEREPPLCRIIGMDGRF